LIKRGNVLGDISTGGRVRTHPPHQLTNPYHS
jgi:hypothetical protein